MYIYICINIYIYIYLDYRCQQKHIHYNNTFINIMYDELYLQNSASIAP